MALPAVIPVTPEVTEFTGVTGDCEARKVARDTGRHAQRPPPHLDWTGGRKMT